MENEIGTLLDTLEENYFVFEDILNFDPNEFLDESIFYDFDTIERVDVPFTLLEMMENN